MDHQEAVEVLERELLQYRSESYDELVRRIDAEPVVCVRSGPSGQRYQLEIQFFWDAVPGGDVRVMGSVDDGGWRTLVPPTRSFIKSATGSFVGE